MPDEKVTFLAECDVVRKNNWYAPNWHQVMFRVRYQRWPNKTEKALAMDLLRCGNLAVSTETVDFIESHWAEKYGASARKYTAKNPLLK